MFLTYIPWVFFFSEKRRDGAKLPMLKYIISKIAKEAAMGKLREN
jgi:hypothetical protein